MGRIWKLSNFRQEIEININAIHEIIRHYTREAGVRNLERDISKVCRKVVRNVLGKKTKKKTIVTEKNIEQYLGVEKFRNSLAGKENQVGQVTGLAWTSVGGEILTIESSMMPGKGKIIQTGKLGDVMQESIQAAMTVVRSKADSINLPTDFFEKHDFHVHVPEGATPKDGPSAGVGMCTALISVITKIPVRADVAMTGEITLRGGVLAIGGLKEKLLAAHRGGIGHVIIPADNKKDLVDIPEKVLKKLKVHPVETIDQVFDLALENKLSVFRTSSSVATEKNLKSMKKIENNDLHA